MMDTATVLVICLLLLAGSAYVVIRKEAGR